jgi:ABC-type transport system involved in multi-copper enzyme maturation permease subunit
MKALLWKDYYINRPLLVFTAVLLALPYVFFGGANLFWEWRRGWIEPWSAVLQDAGLVSLVLTVLVTAVLGGQAIASERADRSAEFLGYLPVSRRAIIGSKVIFALAVCLCMWTFNLAILFVTAPYLCDPVEGTSGSGLPPSVVPGLAATAVLTFGAAWLASALLRSPAIAFVLGVAAPIVLLVALETPAAVLRLSLFDWGYWYRLAGVVLGISGFATGVAVYLRRVEP